MTTGDESTFLRLVTDTLDRRRRDVLDAARAQAREIVSTARRQAAERVRHAIAQNREHRRSELGATRAELGTHLRLVQQRAERQWLESGWPRLLSVLEARWRSPEARRSWIAALVARADALLPPGERWRVEHPRELLPGELDIEREPAPDLVASDRFSAGLCISASGATLDGTPQGLLSRSDLVKGRLLATLERGFA